VRRALTVSEPTAQSWSVPYVDVTLTPAYQFQDPQSNPARDIALAFVVAAPGDPCIPSWGGAYTFDQAGQHLELDRRIAQLRAAGGDIMISAGGQANQELAVACTDTNKLTAAYREIVRRYDINVLDLDIEGTAVADQASIARRATAVATVQKEREAAGHPLAVWLTLPVSTDGLTADGVALVSATIGGHVSLKGVNAMTMDFGDAAHPTSAMLPASEQALQATATQVADIYRRWGVTLDDVQRWAHVGATPMIGQNDVDGEVFTLEDAKGLATFALDKGLGRMSTWSINRDAPCSASFAAVAVHSTTCSGVAQQPLAFANVFTALPGRAPTAPKSDAITVPDQQTRVDDPATSPYPIWRPSAQYQEAYKVVWHGEVYQAKWYNQGSDPSILAATASAAPWALLGPVGPKDTAPKPSPTVTGVTTLWDSTALYAKGDQVLLDGLPYQARWSTKGDVPSTEFPIGPDSPWQPLFTVPGEPTGG
jgi:chitinase